MQQIEVDYAPRQHFLPFHARTQQYACLVCHRGAGKTVASIHDLQRAALRKPGPGALFGYIAPLLTQAKTNAWSHLVKAVHPLRAVGATLHESELRADYPNGNRVRLFGGNYPDALRGAHFDGIILDEFADMDASLWTRIVIPALTQRDGWAVLIGTPRGHNHLYSEFQKSQIDPEWFSLRLPWDQTNLFTPERIESVRKNISTEDFAQEYELSFESALKGAFYAEELRRAETDGRVGKVPIDRGLPVQTAWDLGISDSTAIWFIQVHRKEIRLIDYYEASGVGLDHYAKALKDRGYVYGTHYFPHDVGVRELSTGRSRVNTLSDLGITATYNRKPANRMDGINSVRRLLDQMWIDETRCKRGLEALKQYRREYDERLKDWKTRPMHDWTSHGADALRTFAEHYVEHRPKLKLNLRTRGGSWMSN